MCFACGQGEDERRCGSAWYSYYFSDGALGSLKRCYWLDGMEEAVKSSTNLLVPAFHFHAWSFPSVRFTPADRAYIRGISVRIRKIPNLSSSCSSFVGLCWLGLFSGFGGWWWRCYCCCQLARQCSFWRRCEVRMGRSPSHSRMGIASLEIYKGHWDCPFGFFFSSHHQSFKASNSLINAYLIPLSLP